MSCDGLYKHNQQKHQSKLTRAFHAGSAAITLPSRRRHISHQEMSKRIPELQSAIYTLGVL